MKINGLFFFVLVSCAQASGQTLVITDNNVQDRFSLGRFMEFMIHDNPAPSADSMFVHDQDFAAFPSQKLEVKAHGINRHFWLRFQIENKTKANGFMLVFDNYFIDEIKVFQFRDSVLVMESPVMGDNYAFNKRIMKRPNFVFPVDIPIGSAHEFLIRINMHGRQLIVHPLLMKADVYYEWEASKRGGILLFYGFLFALTLVNYYLGWVFKDTLFGLLGLMLNATLFLFICFGGWGTQFLWPDWPAVGNKAPTFFAYLTALCSLLFSKKFLEDNFRGRWLRLFTISMRVIIGVAILLGLASMSYGIAEYVGIWFVYKLMICSYVILFVCGAVSFRRQHPTARYLALGMLLMALVVFLNIFHQESGEYFYTRKSSLLLFGTGLFFLALSVLDRLTILKVEKEKAQEQAIQNLKSLHDLKSKINEQLEEKINEASHLLLVKQKEINLSYLKGETRERKRVAEELHDGLGGLLSTLKYTLQKLLHDGANTNQLGVTFNQAIDLINQACEEVRSVSHDMMPVVLTEFGLKSAIENLVEKLNYTSGINFKTKIQLPETRFQPEMELTLYRIVLELLNNAVKHSEGSRVFIGLQQVHDTLEIEISDNGKGFDPDNQKSGMGISNMKNRVKYLNGTYTISNKQGTRINISVPLDAKQYEKSTSYHN